MYLRANVGIQTTINIFKTHCSIGGIYIVKSNFSLTFNQPLKTRQDLTFNAWFTVMRSPYKVSSHPLKQFSCLSLEKIAMGWPNSILTKQSLC
jgi:hypothetical protein